MCKLLDGITHSETGHLMRGRRNIQMMSTRALCILHQFLTDKILFFLEVLSIICAMEEAVDAFKLIAKWLPDVRYVLSLVRFQMIIGV